MEKHRCKSQNLNHNVFLTSKQHKTAEDDQVLRHFKLMRFLGAEHHFESDASFYLQLRSFDLLFVFFTYGRGNHK